MRKLKSLLVYKLHWMAVPDHLPGQQLKGQSLCMYILSCEKGRESRPSDPMGNMLNHIFTRYISGKWKHSRDALFCISLSSWEDQRSLTLTGVMYVDLKCYNRDIESCVLLDLHDA